MRIIILLSILIISCNSPVGKKTTGDKNKYDETIEINSVTN